MPEFSSGDILDPLHSIANMNNMSNMQMPQTVNDQAQNLLTIISLLQKLLQLLVGSNGGVEDSSIGGSGGGNRSNSYGPGCDGSGDHSVRGGHGGDGGHSVGGGRTGSGGAGGSDSISSTTTTNSVGPAVGRLQGGDITDQVADIAMKQHTQARITQVGKDIVVAHSKGSHLGDGVTAEVPVQAAKKATFEYDVRFEPGFDFNKGGKMPGLGGGSTPTGGQNVNGDGFTTRMMFREGGKLVAYVYDMDKGGKYGKDIDTGIVMKPGEKYTIRQHVELTSGSNNDGKLQVWVNGKLVIDRDDMRFVDGNNPNNKIDKVMFHSFFGGNGAEWATRNDSTTTMSNLKYQPS